MGQLSGYKYRNRGAVIATVAGAQTSYQLELLVGESSGAAGADVDCVGHCEDFPNDIRFTEEDGTTKHDYWVDISSLEGIAPNRKVSVWIEVTSIPASGSINFWMYYGQSGDSGESEGDNTFELFDDFDYDTEEIPLGNSGCEAIVIIGDYVYYGFDSSPGTIKKYNKSDLSFISSLSLTNNGIEEMLEDGTNIYVGQDNGKLAKVQISTFTEVDTLSLTQGSGLIAGLEIVGNYLYAGRNGDILARILLSDFSTVNYLSMAANTGFAEPGVSDGTYLYVPGEKNGFACRLNRVKLSDFTLNSSLILSKNNGQQNPVIDDGYLYIACEGTSDNGAIVKVNLSSFTETSALIFSGDGQAKNVLKYGDYLLVPTYKSTNGFWHKVNIGSFTESKEWDMGGYRPAEAETIDGNYLYFGVDKGSTWADCYLRKLHLDDFGLGDWIPYDVAGGTTTFENNTYIFTDASGSANVESKHALVNLTKFCVELRLKDENAAQFFYCYLRDENNKNLATVFFYGDEFRYFDGITNTKWGDASDDTFYRWGIAIDQPNNHQDLILNNVKVVNDASMRDPTAGVATRVSFHTSTTEFLSKGTTDWIAVRKYASPEPTWDAWGGEEKTTEKILLKLLQKKGLNIDLLQKLKGLFMDLSQEDKGINLKLSQEGNPK